MFTVDYSSKDEIVEMGMRSMVGCDRPLKGK